MAKKKDPKKTKAPKAAAKKVKEPEYIGQPVSEHISWEEAVESITAKRLGLDNIPPREIYEKMKVTANALFEPLRRFWKVPIAVVSFYRCKKLNEAIGGADNSQHMKGEAMDINAQVLGGISNRQVFEFLENETVFDQLIWEFGDDNEPDWVHVSRTDKNPRREVLRSRKSGGKTVYERLR